MTRALLLLLVLAACDSGKEAVKKVDKALDKLDESEAARRLSSAKDAIAKSLEPAEDCSWVASVADDVAAEAARSSITELRKLCNLEVPLGRALKAVVAAETARSEVPEAPSLTECSSDEWARAKQQLERDYGGEPRWHELRARWTKVCP